MIKNTGPASKEISKEKLARIRSSQEKSIVYIGQKDKEFETFQQIAEVFSSISFAYLSDSSLIEASQPKLSFYLGDGAEPVTYSEPLVYEAVTQWINYHRFPAIMDIEDSDTFDRIFQGGLPNFILFFETRDEMTNEFKAFTNAAEEMRGKATFSLLGIDGSVGQEVAEYFGIKTFPQIGAIVQNNNEFKKYLGDGPLTEDSIQEFFSTFYAGELPEFIMSEPIPENNDLPIKAVVGLTLSQYISEEHKDHLLLEVYAPWCQHCQEFAPKYEALGLDLSKTNPKVTVSKIDGTKNDISLEYDGFPTLFYFAPGSNSPVIYEGELEVEDIKKFLKSKMDKDWVEGDVEKVTEEETDL